LEKLLGDVLEKQNSPAGMVKKMCAKLGVALDDVMSAARTKRVVFARQKIMAALKRSTKLTLSEIGALVGGRNHASVLYAISQIEKAKLADMLLESELSELAK
jgi:chromosomal replication initiator protein